MAAHTTFRVGGCADVFVEIDAIAELEKLCLVLGDNFYLIGNGSNVLVSDSGIRGIVLHLSKAFSAISAEGECLVPMRMGFLVLSLRQGFPGVLAAQW